jgi:N6-L-threonylcarbamoyladenine synthase
MSLSILAIESSCDETSAAILRDGDVLSNVISSQYFHKEYGGIVPELASRAHITAIEKITAEAFRLAGFKNSDIDLVAAAEGPGLIGSLLVGLNFAKGFALANRVPFAGIDHIESHLYSSFIGKKNIDFPFIALVVSGGHTILFLAESPSSSKVLGTTQDDAAGEAFDKVAKMLGLEYPGGPLIDMLAKEGDENYHKFPRPEIKDNPYDFSFSGIKTSVLYYLKKNFPGGITAERINDIAASFQKAVVGSLVDKTIRAAKANNIFNIAVAGGVSANSKLKEEFMKYEKDGFRISFPEKIYSTDNAAMIGFAAYLKYNSVFPDETGLFESAYPRFKYRNI